MSESEAIVPSHGDQRVALEAYAQALRREAHVLADRPDLMWQQLYARLQWCNEVTQRTLERGLRQRGDGIGRPWLQPLSQYRESSELLETFQVPGATLRSVINGCALSVDGRYLVLASGDTSAHVWDLHTHQKVYTLFAHSYAVHDCALSPDQRFLVTACQDFTISVWDFPQGPIRKVIREHTQPVTCCEFSPDGRFLVSGSEDGSLIIWNTVNWAVHARLIGHSGAVNDCAITPDAKFVVSAGTDGILRTWKLPSGDPVMVLTGHEGTIHSCAIGADGHALASAGADGTVRVWDVDWVKATWAERKAFRHIRDEVTSCAFSPNADQLLSGGADCALYLWDISRCESLGTLQGHTFPVTDCCYLADGATVVSTSWFNTTKVWNISHVGSDSTPVYHVGNVSDCRFSPDGTFLTTVSTDSTMKTWHLPNLALRSGTELRPYDWLFCCAISPDGDFIATGGRFEIRLWGSKPSVQRRGVLRGALSMVNGCVITPDAEHLLSASGTSVQVWHLNSETRIRPDLLHDELVNDCQLFPDGRTLATGSNGGLTIWDLRYLRRATQYEAHAIRKCRVSQNGKFIVTAGTDGLLIWPIATGGRVIKLAGHTAPVEGCAIAPDTSLIVSGSTDRTVRLWRSNDGSPIGVMYLPGEIQSVDTHPSLPLVACGDMGGNIYLLKLVGVEYGALLVTARRLKRKLVIRCPGCRQIMTLRRAQLGTKVRCTCGTNLSINAYVSDEVFALEERKRGWWRLFRH